MVDRLKTMKKLIALAAALMLFSVVPIIVGTGCKSTPREVAYKTLFSLQTTVVGAYDGYITEIVKGNVATNSVPAVSKKFNKFQLSYIVALDVANYGTNALAPNSLVAEAGDLINLINSFTHKP